MSFTENILPIIYTRKEKQEWEALVSYPIPTLCLFLRHLYYYQKFPDTSNRFIYVHNDFQTVILIIFFFSHGNNTAFTYIYIQRLKVPGIIIFSRTKSLKPLPCFHILIVSHRLPKSRAFTQTTIFHYIFNHFFPIFLTDKLHPAIFYSMIIGNTSSFYPSGISDRYCH